MDDIVCSVGAIETISRHACDVIDAVEALVDNFAQENVCGFELLLLASVLATCWAANMTVLDG